MCESHLNVLWSCALVVLRVVHESQPAGKMRVYDGVSYNGFAGEVLKLWGWQSEQRG
jgi:hypothetical protein